MSSAFEQLCHQQVINRWRVMNDAVLASTLAAEAGELLLALRGSGDRSPEELRAQGDALSQDLLARRLGEERPDDAVLSEEARDSPARLSASRVWIIDPLDGTREYGEGRADWAVHVALWVDGALAAGAVAIPAEGLVLDTVHPLPRPAAADRLRLALSRTRPPAPPPGRGRPARVGRAPPPPAGVRDGARGAAGRRAGPDGVSRRQGHRGPARPGGRVRPCRGPVRVGLGGSGRRRPRLGAA